jgi:hypothetical protein
VALERAQLMPLTTKTQAGLIEANLPLYVQCLRMPAEWRRAPSSQLEILASLMAGREADPPDPDSLFVDPARGKAETYDPWEKRSEFFRLEEDDTDALLAFLRTVGYFQSSQWRANDLEDSARTAEGLIYSAKYQPTVTKKDIWGLRRLLNNSVRSGDHTGKHTDFPVRILTVKGNPRLVVTTTTFEDALALTLSIDAVRHAKRRKCARPDCGVPFTYTRGYSRKFCTPYCGHIESVRNSRERAKRAKRAQKKGGK